jgi:hypothetical protein
MIEVGMGQLGLSPSAFYEMTLDELTLAIKGWNKREEIRERFEWERTRWLGMISLQPHLRKGRKLKPKDLAVFPWEKSVKPNQQKRLSRDELFDEIQMRDGWQN